MAGGSERDHGDDPLEVVTFDEAFVRAATVVEPSAAERLAALAGPLVVRPGPPPSPSVGLPPTEPSRAWVHRRVRRLRLAAVLVLGALAGSALWWLAADVAARRETATWHDLHRTEVVRDLGAPIATAGKPVRALPPVDPPAGGGGFALAGLRADGRTPIAFDPCHAVRWMMDSTSMPPGASRVLGLAVRELEARTGVRFTRVPGPAERTGPARSPRSADGTWAPVLVAWTQPDAVSELAGPIASSVIRQAVETPDGEMLVSGQVLLDGPQFASLPEVEQARLVRHALGHLVGLDDVATTDQVMSIVGGPARYADGDRRGLARVGAVSCAT